MAGRWLEHRGPRCAYGAVGLLVVASGWVLAGCAPQHVSEDADLSWPSLVAVSLPERGEVSPTVAIRLGFSEPLDPTSLGDDSVVVVPFALGESCQGHLACAELGRCHGGWCQHNPVDGAFIADMERSPLGKARRERIAPARVVLDEDARGLSLYPLEPLRSHHLHALLVGPSPTDLAGNPLRVPPGADLVLEHLFTTGGASLSRPRVLLISPPAGTANLPTNLARIVVGLSKPVRGLSEEAWWLEGGSDARNRRLGLSVQPLPGGCGSQHTGPCLGLVPRGLLGAHASWRLHVAPGVRDLEGRPVFEEEPPVLSTGATADRRAPRLVAQDVRVADGCAVVRLRLDEPADLRISASWGDQVLFAVGQADHEIGIPLEGPLRGVVSVWAEDAAGNRSGPFAMPIEAEEVSTVVISEVLANPAGAEPSQEFVELFNAGALEVELAGWRLDDGDDGSGIALLPRATLPSGSFAVVVGANYSGVSVADPPPGADALLIRLSSTVGARGLSNRGESLALRDAQGRLVSWYTPYWRTDGGADDGRSIERSRPDSCGLRGDWRPNREGTSSPGMP